MKITKSNPDQLVIKDFPLGFGMIFFLAGGGLVYWGVEGLIYNSGIDKTIGVGVIIGLLFLVIAVSFTKLTVFVFDLRQQQLTWSRVGLFGWKGGTISFGRITGCVVQTHQMSDNGPTYRLALASPDGDLPLTETYTVSSVVARQKLRELIHAALRLPAPEPETTVNIDDQIKALMANGKIIAAVKLIRDQRGCSLAEAKGVVDSMKSDSGSPDSSLSGSP